MKHHKRKVTVILIIAIVATLTSCGSSSENAIVPLAYEDCIGENVDEIISEFSEAGFENITTKTITTSLEDKVGEVNKINVDGKGTFLKNTSYAVDTPVEITYYVLREKTQKETEAESEEEKIYYATAESVEELATELFSFEYDYLSVIYDEPDNLFILSYRPTEVNDETSFVYRNVNRYLQFIMEAYNIDGINRIQFDVYLLGMDQYGQDWEILGLSELLDKDGLDKFNWENLDYVEIWNQLNAECEIFEVAPEIIENVDTSKVFYDSLIRTNTIH